MKRLKQSKWYSVSVLLTLLTVPLNSLADKNMVLIVGDETRNERAATAKTDIKQTNPTAAETGKEKPSLHAPEAAMIPHTRKDDTFEFIAFENILFPHNGTALDDHAKQILNKVAAYLRNNKRAKRLLISGFSDHFTRSNNDAKISAKRAFVVREYLRHVGVPPRLMHTVNWGESGPADEHWTRSGRKRNRRVELYLVQQ